MTFKVRAPIWFSLAIAGAFVLFGLTGLMPSFDLSGIIVSVAGAGMALASVNMAVLKVEPDRIVSRLRGGTVNLPLGPDDRLFVADRRLWVLRQGTAGRRSR